MFLAYYKSMHDDYNSVGSNFNAQKGRQYSPPSEEYECPAKHTCDDLSNNMIKILVKGNKFFS